MLKINARARAAHTQQCTATDEQTERRACVSGNVKPSTTARRVRTGSLRKRRVVIRLETPRQNNGDLRAIHPGEGKDDFYFGVPPVRSTRSPSHLVTLSLLKARGAVGSGGSRVHSVHSLVEKREREKISVGCL